MDSLQRRRLLYATIASAAAVLFSYAFVDRPLATFAHGYFPDPHIFVLVARHSTPFIWLGLAILGLAGVAHFLGWRPHPSSGAALRVVLVAATAVCVAEAIKNELKFMIGRTWPDTIYWHNPSWIQDGVYSFSPFHGGLGWSSFPSGHTTVAMTIAVVLARAFPRCRNLLMILVALLGVGLVMTGVHWLSDVIAGAYLGAVCGFAIARLTGIEPVEFEPEATASTGTADAALADEVAREPAE